MSLSEAERTGSFISRKHALFILKFNIFCLTNLFKHDFVAVRDMRFETERKHADRINAAIKRKRET